MARSTDIKRPIVEDLYAEALVLADEVRAAFDLSRGDDCTIGRSESFRLALSIEGLRTTTRVMHCLAWLLNQRAHLSGEMSADQLRRHGALPPDRLSERVHLACFDAGLKELISETERLHARLARLDASWRQDPEPCSPHVQIMYDRLQAAVSAG